MHFTVWARYVASFFAKVTVLRSHLYSMRNSNLVKYLHFFPWASFWAVFPAILCINKNTDMI